jgi:hypothetical protein
MVLCGSLVMAIAFKGADTPSNPAWIWISVGSGFLIAAFLVAQGTVLLMTGRWLV